METNPAYLYLCGRGSCDSIRVNRGMIELFRAGAFGAGNLFSEKVIETVFKMHESRACICKEPLIFRMWEGFETELYNRHEAFLIVKDFIARCEKPIVGVLVFLYMEGSGHANTLVVDRIRKQIELFEPHGVSGVYKNRTHDAIKDLNKKDFFGPGYTVLTPDAMCPDIKFTTDDGPQGATLDDTGTCVLWSLWFLHVRIQNPHMTGKEAQEHALRSVLSEAGDRTGVSQSLSRFITGFATVLMDLLNTAITKSEKYYVCNKPVPGEDPAKRSFPYDHPSVVGNVESSECMPFSRIQVSSGSDLIVHRREVPGFYDEDDDLPIEAWKTLGKVWAESDPPGTVYKHLKFPTPLPEHDPLPPDSRTKRSFLDDDDDDAPIRWKPRRRTKAKAKKKFCMLCHDQYPFQKTRERIGTWDELGEEEDPPLCTKHAKQTEDEDNICCYDGTCMLCDDNE